MGSKHHAVLNITREGWRGENDSGTSLNIASGGTSMNPYELLLLALGSCLEATFEDVAQKMRVSWESVTMDISGEKRDEVPTFLKQCTVSLQVTGASDEKRFERAFSVASRYCSIYQTLSKVAEMDWNITFS